MDTAKLDPEVVVPQIATLVVDAGELGSGERTYAVQEERITDIFAGRKQELFDMWSQKIDTSQLDNVESGYLEALRQYTFKVKP